MKALTSATTTAARRAALAARTEQLAFVRSEATTTADATAAAEFAVAILSVIEKQWPKAIGKVSMVEVGAARVHLEPLVERFVQLQQITALLQLGV